MKDKFFLAAHKGEKSTFDTYRAGLGIAAIAVVVASIGIRCCDGTYA